MTMYSNGTLYGEAKDLTKEILAQPGTGLRGNGMQEPRQVTIMGLGLFGGGLGAVEYFASEGWHVTVTDLKSEEQLRPSLEKLRGRGVVLRLGGHRESDFTETDLVVVNPAVPRESPYVALARSRGVPLETEIGLFFRKCRAPIVGVTGSIGKTTTTSMIGKILEAGARRVHVGGNIGRSLLCESESIGPGDVVVLELSSFQLEWLGEAGLAPRVAVVTNVCRNHLDRHGTMEAYIAAKRSILRGQGPGSTAVLNADDPEVSRWAADVRGQCLFFSSEAEPAAGCFLRGGRIILRRGGAEAEVAAAALQVPGRHNLANALAAVAACSAAGMPPGAMAAGLASFSGIEHRLEFACRRNGVRYYNDSKATTPESAMAALDAFDCPVVLIAGGYDKKVPLDAFARRAACRTRATILIGETADKLAWHLDGSERGDFRWLRASSLPDAVAKAASIAVEGDVVLLSPACASYDMFENYEERGRQFKNLCRSLKEGKRPGAFA